MRTLATLAWQCALIVALASLGTAWTYHSPRRPALYVAPPTPALPPGLTIAEVFSWSPSPTWIDTRSAEAYAEKHFPDAISLSPNDLDKQLAAHVDLFMDRRHRYVLYGPPDSNRVVIERLKELGLQKLHQLDEGWEAHLKALP